MNGRGKQTKKKKQRKQKPSALNGVSYGVGDRAYGCAQ